MLRLSSSLTLFFKLFIPVFWIVFFTTIGIGTLLIPKESMSYFSNWQYRAFILIFLSSGYLLLYFTLFQLKRVDADDQALYISNYFKTYRYPFPLVHGYRTSNLIGLQIVRIVFLEKGYFGKSVVFIASKALFRSFTEKSRSIHKIES